MFALLTLVSYAMVHKAFRRCKLQPTPCELQFYDEYFVVYYPRRYYSKHKIRREFYMMEYTGLRDVHYNKDKKRIEFTGCIKSGYIPYDKLDRLIGDYVNYNVREGDLYLQPKFEDDGLASCLADHLKFRSGE